MNSSESNDTVTLSLQKIRFRLTLPMGPLRQLLSKLFFILLDFLLYFATGNVTKDMLDEEENVNAIRKLTEEFDEVC